jgi:hypothetical protein
MNGLARISLELLDWECLLLSSYSMHSGRLKYNIIPLYGIWYSIPNLLVCVLLHPSLFTATTIRASNALIFVSMVSTRAGV